MSAECKRLLTGESDGPNCGCRDGACTLWPPFRNWEDIPATPSRVEHEALVLKVAQQEREIENLRREVRTLHRRERERQATERGF